MRILITTESRGSAGGIETYLKALVPRLMDAGHELSWLFGNSPYYGTGPSNLLGEPKWVIDSKNCENVEVGISRWKPDVIYAHGLRNPKWDNWLSQRYPTAYFAHGYFGACISGRKCHSIQTIKVCQRPFGPKCLLLYFPLRCGGRSPLRMLKDYRLERQRKQNLTQYRMVIVASQYMAHEYCRQGVSFDKLRVLPLFSPDAEPDPTPPEPRAWTNRVLLIGRLTDLKGVSFAVEAVSVASKILERRLTLVVAGEGPGRQTLADDGRKHGIPIEFPGWINSEKRNQAMRQADILLVPSVWPEPFGLVGIEAGCVGLPAAAFDVGGISEWLTPGESGELAEANPPTAAGLGSALAKAMSDPERYNRLRYNAWRTALRFGVQSHLQQLTQILDSIC